MIVLKIYNSLRQKLEAFQPINGKRVKLYTCGPTVYDHAHIGNFRTYIFEDTLKRTLNFLDNDVLHVMNITDVDDKTIAKSQEKYPDEDPLSALGKLTSRYEKIFFADAELVGIDFRSTKIVRATEHIDDMKELISQIPTKYIKDDGVYFDIERYPDYGKLVKLNRSHSHHRIANDEYDKDHVADFALWKRQKPNEPAWDFELDGVNMAGRPGWHIECSAMSAKYLGVPFDIHTGGVDLKFPHHENEIAQTKSATGSNLANYFLHVEHLLVNGHKMSKSLDNFYTLNDISKKSFGPLAFRLLMLQAHYRSQLNFTWESLAAAQNFLHRLQSWADLVHQPEARPAASPGLLSDVQKSLANDMNTPRALAAIGQQVDTSAPSGLLLEQLDYLFGLSLSHRPDITTGEKQLIRDRETARQQKNWPRADELRAKLAEKGIEIEDLGNGAIWHRSS